MTQDIREIDVALVCETVLFNIAVKQCGRSNTFLGYILYNASCQVKVQKQRYFTMSQ